MTEQEKARAYDEAIKRAKKGIDNPNISEVWKTWTRDLFPELEESEDERIRKEIIEYIKTGTYHKSWLTWLEKQGKNKTIDWSEEDEKMYKGVMAVCDMWSTSTSFYPKENNDIERLKKWLNSLKNRISSPLQTTYSKEDLEIINRIADFILKNRKGDTDEIYQQEQDVKWLKSLKPFSKQKWSEEDESLRLRTIGALETCKIGSPTKCVDEQINWLKSLKQRYIWKPSDKQIHAFEQVYDWYNNNFMASETLTSLYNDLKKLKEK